MSEDYTNRLKIERKDVYHGSIQGQYQGLKSRKICYRAIFFGISSPGRYRI